MPRLIWAFDGRTFHIVGNLMLLEPEYEILLLITSSSNEDSEKPAHKALITPTIK